MWCFFCAKNIEKEQIATIDYSSLLQKAIVHDFDELGTGDIPRVTKYADQACLERFKIIENKSIQQLEKFIDCDLLGLWNSAKDSSLEGKLVKFADISAVVYKSWIEIVRKNNYSFHRVSREVEAVLKGVMQEITKDLDNTALRIWFDAATSQLINIAGQANRLCEERGEISTLGFSIND